MKDIHFQTFLINMKRSPERLDFMSKQLERLNLDFEIQEGIDASVHDFSNVYDEEIAKKYNGIPLTIGEKGCALSHKTILEKMLERNLDYVLILEDDVDIPHNFKETVEKMVRENEKKHQKWEYLAFNYPHVGLRQIRLWLHLFFAKWEKDISAKKFLAIPLYCAKFAVVCIYSFFEALREFIYRKYIKPGRPVLFYRPLYLAGCYLITRSGAQKLLSFGDKLIYPADRIQNAARIKKGLRLYAFCPMIVTQRRDKFKSTLNNHDISSILDILV